LINLARSTLEYISSLNIQRPNLTKEFTHYNFSLENYLASYAHLFKCERLLHIRKFVDNNRLIRNNAYHRKILDWGVGNCGELATLAFHFMTNNLHKHPAVKCIEYVYGIPTSTKPFDHAMIILNRKSLYYTHPFTLKGLNEDALIVDPWINCYFTPEKITEYLGYMANMLGWAEPSSFFARSLALRRAEPKQRQPLHDSSPVL